MSREIRFDAYRRKIIQAGIGISILGLSGCTSKACVIKPPEAFTLAPVSNPFLSPDFPPIDERLSHYSIDVHVHLFNASDVNVKGFVEPILERDKLPPKLKKMAPILAKLIQKLADKTMTADQEYDFLTSVDAQYGQKGKQTARSVLDKRMAQIEQTQSQAIVDYIKGEGEEQLFLELYNETMDPTGSKQAKESVLSPGLVLDIIKGRGSIEQKELALSEQDTFPGMLRFVWQMLTPRWNTLLTYQKAFNGEDGNYRIDAIFSSLVDFDHWLEGCPKSSRLSQVKLHGYLSRLSGGYMLPLVSYNPWTDIKYENASFTLMQMALEKYGFIGVKIYPANGFYPHDNVSNSSTTEQSRPNLEALDLRLEAFFNYCAKNDIPVMAHTAKSMGKDEAADEFGGPRGWVSLSDSYKGKDKKPIINAGHFGGAENWTIQMAGLMKKDSGLDFYGDLGYWSEFNDCNEKFCFAKVWIEKA
ncbi:MAG: hypothetical protein OEX19_09685, partial [Gammaproteobacteria bacterium]|nr:hypothetical protein [Gammaproteobacteria bacterium]